jgi:hypothetical protein
MTSQESKKKFVRATVGKSGGPPQLAASFILERLRGQSAAGPPRRPSAAFAAQENLNPGRYWPALTPRGGFLWNRQLRLKLYQYWPPNPGAPVLMEASDDNA